ncbi:hypothetical protein PM082_019286 [Marasmius tenuissimus]|nr:hypothetical protein PM082_019286 [Marasmius tenuissimus]
MDVAHLSCVLCQFPNKELGAKASKRGEINYYQGGRGLWAKNFRLNEDLFSADWLGTRDTAVRDP